jgi:hypothetical protein
MNLTLTEPVLCGSVLGKEAVGREPTLREGLSAEVEESPVLETVTTERLVKTQQAGEYLACPVMICELWRLSIAL